MSDAKFNLKPVRKKKSRRVSRARSSDEYSAITDNEKDSTAFLSEHNYQSILTAKLDNLEQKEFDQKLLNEIILWKVNRYATFSEEHLKKID